MKIKVTCPCGCGHEFEVDVPKGKKEFSPEERARRAERMRAMGGRPKGAKGREKPKAIEVSVDGGVMNVDQKSGDSRLDTFMDLCGHFETDPKKCPYAMTNGGPCDGVYIGEDGSLEGCRSMITCKFKYRKYELYRDNEGTP